jgi:cadmium resistance protein CadD (predicted permease)
VEPEPFIALLGLVAIAFASTNMDNLLVLVGLQVSGRLTRGQLFRGYTLGMFGILIVSLLLGLVGYLFPLEYLGYLGIIPILVGLKLLVGEWRRDDGDGVEEVAAMSGSIFAVAATQLSNGVDTVLVFAPLLADSLLKFDMAITALFLVMILLWFGLAQLLSHHLGRLSLVDRLGRWLAPVVMIGVGLYILSNTSTDLIPS